MIERLKARLKAAWDWWQGDEDSQWRTWVGHGIVWGLAFGGSGYLLGATIGLAPGLPGEAVELAGAIIGWVAGSLFYGQREFLPGSGDFWKYRNEAPPERRRAGMIDSKMDWWLALIISGIIVAGLLEWSPL